MKFHLRIFWSIKGKYESNNPNSSRRCLCMHKKLEAVDNPDELLSKSQK